MDRENQSLVFRYKGKKPLDRPNIDVVVDKYWHHEKGKSKGKSMNMQCNSFSLLMILVRGNLKPQL